MDCPYSLAPPWRSPGRQVVCVVGDGGLTMLMGEIATLVKYKLPVKVIVVKNNVLGQIKWEQMVLAQIRNSGSNSNLSTSPRSRRHAACMAVPSKTRHAESVLRKALKEDGPSSYRRWWTLTSHRCRATSTQTGLHFAEALGKKKAQRDREEHREGQDPQGGYLDGVATMPDTPEM